MIKNATIKKIVHKLHLEGLVKSLEEFHRDNRGGFLIPSSNKLTDSEYTKYRHLPINWTIPSITKEDLPEVFSPQAVKTVDLFRRKTIDLDYECMIMFDYITGKIVSCNFSDDNYPDQVNGIIYRYLLKNRNIASIHNHPKQYSSPPSGKNFEMLGFDFEEYELISAPNEFWILESKQRIFTEEEINEIRTTVDSYYKSLSCDINSKSVEGFLVIDNLNKIYGDFLLEYLNNNFTDIKLTRRFMNE